MNTQTQTRHPEAPPIPDSVAWQPIPIYNHPQQPPASPPPAIPSGKAIAAGVLTVGALMAGVTWRVHEAAYVAGAADAQAEISQLKTQASTTNARIETFCNGAQ